jgi:hypothetical protein
MRSTFRHRGRPETPGRRSRRHCPASGSGDLVRGASSTAVECRRNDPGRVRPREMPDGGPPKLLVRQIRTRLSRKPRLGIFFASLSRSIDDRVAALTLTPAWMRPRGAYSLLMCPTAPLYRSDWSVRYPSTSCVRYGLTNSMGATTEDLPIGRIICRGTPKRGSESTPLICSLF